jgi:hypothetical protein
VKKAKKERASKRKQQRNEVSPLPTNYLTVLSLSPLFFYRIRLLTHLFDEKKNKKKKRKRKRMNIIRVSKVE